MINPYNKMPFLLDISYSSKTWNDYRINLFTEYFSLYKDIKCSYLEVGTFEGASLLWTTLNILTNSESKAYTFDTSFRENLMTNLIHLPTNILNKINLIHGDSNKTLKKFEQFVDIIYIDGSHKSKWVLCDCIFAFDRLKFDGIMIMDDYNLSDEMKTAIDAFLNCYKDHLDILHKKWCVVIKKKRLDN